MSPANLRQVDSEHTSGLKGTGSEPYVPSIIMPPSPGPGGLSCATTGIASDSDYRAAVPAINKRPRYFIRYLLTSKKKRQLTIEGNQTLCKTTFYKCVSNMLLNVSLKGSNLPQ